MKTGLVSVQFTRSWSTYSKGETAGFRQTRAQMLVDSGVASFVPKSRLGRRAAEKITADTPEMVTK